MARNKTRRELEYKKTNNPGATKKEDKSCLLILWVLLVMIFIGFVSKDQFSLELSKDKVTAAKKDGGKNSENPHPSNDGNNTEEIVQPVREPFKPFKIASHDGSYEIWIMDAWFREERYFTQGLSFVNSTTLLETSGLYGFSHLNYINLNDTSHSVVRDEAKPKITLEKQYFGEGNDILQGTSPKEQFIYYLTWQNRKIFKYDLDFKLQDTLDLPNEIREGWGITHDPQEPTIAYISDGSSNLYKVETNNYVEGKQVFKVVETIKVTDPSKNDQEVKMLNELEWANGYIFANIWTQSIIAKIDPKTGKAVRIYNFTALAEQAAKIAMTNLDQGAFDLRNYCLNGIAWMQKDGYQDADGSFFVTGKMWPIIYKVKFYEKKSV